MSELPSIGDLAAPLLASVPERQRPLLVALAERIAARRYRDWAEAASGADRERLLACADREEEIARRVEALFPDADAVQAELGAKHPDLEARYRDVFEGQSIAAQYAIQAQGERLGADTWRALAPGFDRPEAREALLECAQLEEQNAQVLESLSGE